MKDDVAIKVDHISKTFKLPHERHTSIKSALINFGKRNRGYEQQQVLKDIDFDIKKGEFFGIVGRNGSGKSTLLKLIAGIYTPNSGMITVHGSLTPFIELGVGFNPELSGRENVLLNGALLGFSRKEMEAMYEDIVAFAELERFMDQKLKNYSSGMQVRLAFSIAIRARSDILLLDEVLAVGDAIFQKKCYDYFKELKKLKKTVILVSHDTAALLEFCDKAILVESGEIVAKGNISSIINEYTDILNGREEKAASAKQVESKERWGNGNILITKASAFADNSRTAKTIFTDEDKSIRVRVFYESKINGDKPTYGITVTDGTGQRFFVSNTVWAKVPTKNIYIGQTIVMEWTIPNVFNTGTYYISPAVSGPAGGTYDWRENLVQIKVRKKQQSAGIINVEHAVKFVGSQV